MSQWCEEDYVECTVFRKSLPRHFPKMLWNFQCKNQSSSQENRHGGVSLQPDMRGRHEHKMTKLLPEARNMIIDYICCYKATESHYRRAKTLKKYFDCNVSMRRMWQDICAKHPNFKANCSKAKNKGPVVSMLTFRNIFQQNLRDILSFRKARMDSCQYCDATQNGITQISSEIKIGN